MISHQDMQQVQKRGTGSKVPRFFVLMVMIFIAGILPACSKKKSEDLINRHAPQVCSLATRQSEARMIDIPLPVGGEFVSECSSLANEARSRTEDSKLSRESVLNKWSALTYRVSLTRETLIRFYESEMMRLGWNKLAQSSGEEEMLVFENPLKVSIIHLSRDKQKKGRKYTTKIVLKLYEMVKAT